jgi:hypothetical protein
MSVDTPTMSAIFCGRDNALSADASQRRMHLAELFISAWKLSPVAGVYFTARGAAAAVHNPAWFIWSEPHSGRSQRQPFDAVPRFLDPLRCCRVRGAWHAQAQD